MPANMIKVTVVLECPSSEKLAYHSRAEKYNAMRENTAKLRERIIEWIRNQGLEEEISRVGEPTAFNVLFVYVHQRLPNNQSMSQA